MGSVRVAIAGVGNCAASLVQGVEYYKDAAPDSRVPGLMHVQFGDYHVKDVKFVAAFDVDSKKVGLDLAEHVLFARLRLERIDITHRVESFRRTGLSIPDHNLHRLVRRVWPTELIIELAARRQLPVAGFRGDALSRLKIM